MDTGPIIAKLTAKLERQIEACDETRDHILALRLVNVDEDQIELPSSKIPVTPKGGSGKS